MNKTQSRFLLLVAIVFGLPHLTFAHDIIKGGNAFYNGMLHPFLSLPHLLVLIANACLLGKSEGASRDAQKQKAWWVFLAALAVSLGCAAFSIGFAAEWVLLILACILGLLLAVNIPLPQSLFYGLAIASGLFMGLAFALEESSAKIGLNFGTLVSLYLAFLYLTLLCRNFSKKNWQKIGLRVLGSWIAAASMLNLALDLLVKKAN